MLKAILKNKKTDKIVAKIQIEKQLSPNLFNHDLYTFSLIKGNVYHYWNSRIPLQLLLEEQEKCETTICIYALPTKNNNVGIFECLTTLLLPKELNEKTAISTY